MSAEFAAQVEGVLRIAPAPRPLGTLREAAEMLGVPSADVTEQRIQQTLAVEAWADPLHRVLRTILSRWDHHPDGEWTGGTGPNTPERRVRIYDLLDLDPSLREDLDLKVPFYSSGEPVIVIADRFESWYTDSRRAGSHLYWDAFAGYLRDVNGWDPEDVLSLDDSTTRVVERLSDPSRPEIYQAKGLVVGHVQSGKTANITGVVAKAGDAGYRLVIVMSGTMNLLRAQTQRRIDRELIGRELIRPQHDVPDDEELDYLMDEEWDSFISHGGRPSERGSFDWIRLTGERDDYRRLRAGIQTLEFERRDRTKPFHDPENLAYAGARIMVIKKNASVLRRVAQDLGRITARLADVPALVVDDESDLASVNTRRPPSRPEQRERTAINRAIVELLQQLPRAQYIGYTATPFANVFIDPADAEDLFPKDVIVSLPRPRLYMGARDFHDLDGPPLGSEEDRFKSNRVAFIRDLRGADEEDDNLRRAIDCYVIAGAIKLYRKVELPAEAVRRDPFRHHTMLVHSSRLVDEQRAMADTIRRVLERTAYEAGPGVRRLRDVFERDFVPVSGSREPELPFPASFEQLRPYIGRTLGLLSDGASPVLIVNGERGNDDPDFDKQRIWKIVVGGAKLSRGYTVEGLTISYFRRTAQAGDTLMQMGRWFGFRPLYRDLVRVFIGREEGRTGAFDIYEAFEGICRDEEAFREELLRYAMPEDGAPPITPMQVPPLVASHLEWVRPTARNKMFNARIQFANLGGLWREKTLAPVDSEIAKRRANEALFRRLIDNLDLVRERLGIDGRAFEALVSVASGEDVVEVLGQYQWMDDHRSLERELEFMRGTGEWDPQIRDWAFVAPQLADDSGPSWAASGHEFSVKFRSRIGGERVGAYSEPHPGEGAAANSAADPTPGVTEALEALRGPGRGVLVFYPLTHIQGGEPADGIPTMGFGLQFPTNNMRTLIRFGVNDPSRPDAPVVDQVDDPDAERLG